MTIPQRQHFAASLPLQVFLLLGLSVVALGSGPVAQSCIRNGFPTYEYCNNLNDVCTFCAASHFNVCNCNSGSYCRSPDSQCIACPAGKYCPSENMTSPVACPKDHYCPKNSVQPMECNGLSYCGEESERYYFVGGLPISILLFGLILIAQAWSIRKRTAAISAMPVDEGASGAEAKEDESKSEEGEIEDTKEEMSTSFIPIDLELIDVSYSILKGNHKCSSRISEKILLTSVSGKFLKGTVSGILGPLDSGKTTLLNILTGKLQCTGGSLLINDMEDNINRYSKVVGFVSQQKFYAKNLSVYDLIFYSAQLRLPALYTREDCIKWVEKTLKIMNLGHLRDAIVSGKGSLSAGESRKLNIAIEVAARPSLLILDEPTANLDPDAAYEVMQCLHDIAYDGTNVICALTEPRNEIFKFLDQVLLLSMQGRIAYLGPTSQCYSYFEQLGFPAPPFTNAIDVLIDILSGKIAREGRPDYHPDDLLLLWQEQAGDSKPVELQEKANNMGGWRASLSAPFRKDDFRITAGYHLQIWIYFKRVCLQNMHGVRSLIQRLMMYLFTGCYLGIAFFTTSYEPPMPSAVVGTCPCLLKKVTVLHVIDGFTDTRYNHFCSCTQPIEDDVGLMGMYFCMALGSLSAALVARDLIHENRIYLHDSSAGLKMSSYFIAKNLSYTVQAFIFSVFFLSSFILIAAPFASYGRLLGVTFVLIYASQGLGSICAFTFNSDRGPFYAAVLALAWSVCSGYVFDVKKMDAFGDMSYPRWIGQALFDAETKEFTENAMLEPALAEYAEERYGYEIDSYTKSCGYVFVIGIVLRIIAFIALKLRCYTTNKV
eukprot:Nk52_evm16s1401 gene=Nk52_evmTU16s1401